MTSAVPKISHTTSDATASEAGLLDAPGSLHGSSGWSSTEPTDGAVHGADLGERARQRGFDERGSAVGF
ncbi:hypothetical protein [Arthrobacter sp. 31Y]|uniref:hypothetical protein n=1 Tax=Arthrobacter sp. 31Y TaxID=1115632 RepID=UPI0005BB5A8E